MGSMEMRIEDGDKGAFKVERLRDFGAFWLIW